VRRHRAGRNVQLSLKVSAGVKEQFTAVAAATCSDCGASAVSSLR